MTSSTAFRLQTLRDAAYPLTGSAGDYDGLLQRVGDFRFVLIGEATHGTHEFYEQRALITKRLIDERGFAAVAAEADWPDAYRANCYVRGASSARSAADSLKGFARFPTWMWRNTVVVEFLEWLRGRNAQASRPAGFYGLDLYSLYTSIDSVLRYLDRVDPDGAARARYRYSCFEHFREDSQAYGYAASFDISQSCEEGALRQLLELRQNAAQYASRDGRVAEDEQFYAVQNARLVKNAEEYYRTMFAGRISSWNLRDRHMADTLDELSEYLGGAKIVVWEHNSHVGDARATDMTRRGELNVGQLIRERHPGEVYIVGFTTNSGHVTAAADWGAPAERMRVRPGLRDSYEELFHGLELPRFMFDLAKPNEFLSTKRLERAIGVIYRPSSERLSHYFLADMPRQFDTVIHIDETRALEPLETTPQWESGEPPETFPFGE
jgi:erythromycin esterase-like protein